MILLGLGSRDYVRSTQSVRQTVIERRRIDKQQTITYSLIIITDELTSTFIFSACALDSYDDFSLLRQRRLYQQPSGGWVSSERAPSHLLPTTCPTGKIDNEHGTTTAPKNHTTQQQQLIQRADINNAIVLS
jgi:hypothetical protein